MSEPLALRCCTVDLARRRVLRGGEQLRLTTIEARLLAYLQERPGRDVSREELLQEVWGYRPGVQSRAVDATVNRLRVKIEADAHEPDHLTTVWGTGYRLVLGATTGAPPPAEAPGNLGLDLDRFFGRRAELEAVRQALADGDRLVSLVGTAGVGKTRLARELARRLGPEVPGGAWFLPLEHAHDAEALRRLAAQALGVQGEPRALTRWLGERGELLLVVDNLEQALPAAAQVLAEWLQAAPQARMIATSREPLRVGGERVVEVGPLDPEAARALFLDRAEHHIGRGAEDPAVDRVVARLDALPLALELAAGLTEILQPAELLQRLDQMLDLLASDRRDRPDRHSDLRTAIAGSVALLDEEERRALAAATVFRGGMDLAGAEAVLGLSAARTVGVLRALRRRSLLREEPGGRARLSPYVAVRAYMAEQLAASGLEGAVRERHCRWYAAQAAVHGDPTGPPPEGPSRAWLADEQLNLAAALDQALPDQPALAADLALALFQHHAYAGPVQVAVQALDRALAVADRLPLPTRGHLLRARAVAWWYAGETERTEADAEAALALADQAGDRLLAARARPLLGGVAALRRDMVTAAGHFRASLALQQALGDVAAQAATLSNLATCLWSLGDLSGAREALLQARDLERSLGQTRSAALQQAYLGSLDGVTGQVEQGREALHQAIHQLHQGRHRYHEALALQMLSELELNAADDPLTALELEEQASALHVQHGSALLAVRSQLLRSQALWALGRVQEADAALCVQEHGPFPTHADLVRLIIDLELGRGAVHRKRWQAAAPCTEPLTELRRLTGLAWLAWDRDPATAPAALEQLAETQVRLGLDRLTPTAVLRGLVARLGGGTPDQPQMA